MIKHSCMPINAVKYYMNKFMIVWVFATTKYFNACTLGMKQINKLKTMYRILKIVKMKLKMTTT